MEITKEELKEILKEVRQIQIRTGKMVSDVLAGEYHSVFKGRGMEFEEVREYLPGDEVRNIDWNVTARMNKPFVKNFQEERELTVMLLVDVSSSAGFGTTGFSKANIIAKICATIAFSAIQNKDKVGLILFSDEIKKYIPPKKGSKHVLRVIRELLVSAKIIENAEEKAATDVKVALEHLNRLQKRRGICFIVSDFLAPDFERDLRITARKHEVAAISVADPRESEMIDVGLIELEDAETGEIYVVDTSQRKFREMFCRSFHEEQDKRKKFFASLGIDFIEIDTGLPFEQPLLNFFRLKGRRR